MARAGQIARRTFLVGSVAIAGGAAFGVWKLTRPVENPLRPVEGVSLNPFLIIDASGVTLVVGRAEMGQGAQTTLAALLAEELDLAWEAVRLIHGPASAAYHNAALAEMGLPFADYAMTDMQHRLAGAAGTVSRVFGLQITGGSTSIRDGYDSLRLAGASAREALKSVAADRLGVPVADLRTEAGAVLAPDGRRLDYAALAEAAARRPAPQVEPRSPAEWRLLGRSLPRPDMQAKATGAAIYGVDIRLPGMKFATVRMSPRLGGTMRGFDPAPALAMPGVERVIDLRTGIAVVARNTWTAIRAAEAVTIDWGPAPYPETTEAIFARIAEAFDGRRNSRLRNDGDIEEALEGAESVLEVEYRLPFLAHATMEPMTATARFTGDALELWTPNQTPLVQARLAAEAVGLDPDQVTVHTPFLGGGFGRRLEADYSALAARVAREMPDVPVQVTWSREEDMTHDFYRPGVIARMRGVVSAGRATALEARIAAPSVTRQAVVRMTGLPAFGPDTGHVEGAFDQPYAIPNYRVEGYLADLDIPLGFWRSVGHSHNGFIHESFVDELAHAAGRDPMEFRLEAIRPESEIAANVLDQVARMSDWFGERPAGTGRGVAFVWSFGTPVAQVIEVVDEDGRIRIARAWIACDVGRALDPGIVQAQMESGLIFGLSAAVRGEITFADGEVQERNFDDYDALRISAVPRIETRILQVQARLGGVGEPGTPPAAPALANAIFDLTGQRLRTLPLARHVDFVS
ncbi:molybdopterin cofactor-binding domain-containing protein [Pararhodobacter sp. SW119]|uniref:xanthine dehydrogenase family protein molybdopterin-binding subunit n=1 Tax=Pararhodobacter sp. SW119 TaxID=2780075 RepID=UPI001ADF09EC|nr:molybdopterin cofactor-binding domain-containing protein [Pararhodobacter sp. SW119]